MPLAWLALNLPPLLSRILRLAVPVAPLGPYRASLSPRHLPCGTPKHPPNHPHPTRHLPALNPLPSPLDPSSPTPPRPPSHPRSRVSTPTTDTPANPPKHTPPRLKSFLGDQPPCCTLRFNGLAVFIGGTYIPVAPRGIGGDFASPPP